MNNLRVEWSHKSWKVVMIPSDTETWWLIINSFCKEAWTCSLCLCSKSFHMCQWRQRFPDDSDFWWSSCTSVLSRCVHVEIGGCSLQCRPLLGCFQDRGCVYEVCMNTAHSAVLCQRCTLQIPLAPSRLRQTLALELPPRHFLLLRNRHQKRRLTHHRSVHPSVHTSVRDWVSDHAIVPSSQPGTKSNISKAAIRQSSPTSELSFRVVRSSVSSFKN